MNNKKIGEFISSLRKSNNLTQKDLADQLGVTDKAVSKWERGAGYPDISMLKPLADILGTSVTELLEGEASENSISDQSKDIENALDYAKKIISVKEHKLGNIGAAVLAVSLFLAVFTCVIVDLAVNRGLTWSLLVIDSCVMGALLFIPPLIWKKKGILSSLFLLTVFILPFLGIIQSITNTPSEYSPWLWKLAFPITVTWLPYLWLMVILFYKGKVSLWYKLCIALVLSIPGNVFTNFTVDRYLGLDTFDISRQIANIIIIVCMLSAAIVCFLVGLMKKNKGRS
jgi:transcriptional regulator with XRE-family HTH domain